MSVIFSRCCSLWVFFVLKNVFFALFISSRRRFIVFVCILMSRLFMSLLFFPRYSVYNFAQSSKSSNFRLDAHVTECNYRKWYIFFPLLSFSISLSFTLAWIKAHYLCASHARLLMFQINTIHTNRPVRLLCTVVLQIRLNKINTPTAWV